MSNKLWVLLAVSFLAGVMAVWLAPEVQFLLPFIAFVTCGCFALSLGICVLVSRFERTDVTTVERLARRMFFKKIEN